MTGSAITFPGSHMPAERLSTAVFRETRGVGFFRVLAGRNAPFYVDVLDRLDHESSDRADGIAREEAVAIIVETLEAHPDFDWDAELDGPEAAAREQDTRTKARAILEGRIHVSCSDIRKAAKPVLRHRIMTNFAADSEGLTTVLLIERLVKEVEEPSEKDY